MTVGLSHMWDMQIFSNHYNYDCIAIYSDLIKVQLTSPLFL